jgi:hypothetical protein
LDGFDQQKNFRPLSPSLPFDHEKNMVSVEVSFAGKIIEPNGGFFPASHGDDFRRVSNFKTVMMCDDS